MKKDSREISLLKQASIEIKILRDTNDIQNDIDYEIDNFIKDAEYE